MPSASSVDDCYTAAFPRFVVLQLKLWDADHSRISLAAPEDVLSSARLRTWNGIPFPALTDEDTLIFLALDTFHHMLGYWCKLFWFFEIAYFLKRRSSDAAFWERFHERIKGHTHLTEVIGLVLSLAARLFRVELPAAINARVIQSLPPALSLWVEQYGEDWALKEFPGSKLSLFIQRELILDPAAWREVRRIRLIPFHRSSRVAEPSSPSLSSRVEAGRQQWTHILRRIKFHTTTTSQYLWELPRWRRILRRASAG
jgi:hypothetical protein